MRWWGSSPGPRPWWEPSRSGGFALMAICIVRGDMCSCALDPVSGTILAGDGARSRGTSDVMEIRTG